MTGLNVNENNAHEGLSNSAAAGSVADGTSSVGGGVGHRAGNDGHSHRGVTPVPSSIVQALCQIMVTVEAVKKTSKNQHGGYNFASTDDIYAAVTRKMGEVGLILLSLEDRCEIKRIEKDGKTAQWAHMEFSFVLATTSDTWTDARAKRTLYIQVTGPQTFQAAQSYVEKAYLRSLLKLPTGDMDLDSMPQADSEDDQIALAGPRAKRKSSAEGKRDGSVKRFNELRSEIQQAINPEMLRHVREVYAGEEGPWTGMPPAWASTLDEDYEVKMAAFEAVSAAE